jgi:hypothetical protein
MPPCGRSYDRKFHASAECWSVFEEVLAAHFQNSVLFGQVHQLTVDAYAVQHTGGRHPDKSVCVHLVGLCLALERGVAAGSGLQGCGGSGLRTTRLRASWPGIFPDRAKRVAR